MSYYIELTCRIADAPKFHFLGLSAIHHSSTSVELAGQTNDTDLVAKLRAIPVPLRGFRSGDEHADPAIFVSDGRDFLAMPTTPGDQRPYAALESNGLPSKPDSRLAQNFYELSAAVSEALSE
jgi:hypothetical protein